MLRLGWLLCYAKWQPGGRLGRLREARLNFDYKVWEDIGVTLTMSSKSTRPFFVSYSTPAAHFQGYTPSSMVHPESEA